MLKRNYKKNSLWSFENKETVLCLEKHKKKPCLYLLDIGRRYSEKPPPVLIVVSIFTKLMSNSYSQILQR